MRTVRKMLIAAAALTALGAAYRVLPNAIFAKEPAASAVPAAGTADALPSCHLPDDGSPIVVPEQKK